MKQHKFGWKQALFIAAAVVLLIAAGFGIKALIRRGSAPEQTVTGQTETPDAAEKTPEPSAAANAPEETKRPRSWEVDENNVRLNRFITDIVQQNITNTSTDLDEDEELVRFVFGFRRANDPEAVAEREYNGVSCRALTLEQINETLTYYFGKTISPDREDYSITLDENESFNCIYQDGWFLNVPPYPTEQFSFPVRFALVESVDEETCTLHFRLYRMNPYAWEDGEAERHVPIMPLMSIFDAEGTNEATRDWIYRIGTGEAVLRDLGDELQLLELTCDCTN